MTPPDNESVELLFKDKHPVRVVKADGTLWFDVRDLAAALGYTYATVDLAANDPDIPECCRSIGAEVAEGDDVSGELGRKVVLLSPLGVWYWTCVIASYAGQALAAWAKREAARLVPEASPDDPRAFLQFEPDGSMPRFCPRWYSGRRNEWIALQDRKTDILFESSRSDSGEQKREPRTLPSEDEKAALLAEAQAMVERARAVEAERQGVSTS
ncbi:hypothetical protein [Caenibius sp. WL]|uniref:hypothetical protein n=1 Tax=Caenibius sp. WL TaxID=2872646 RepID=UPI001C9A00A7|nr:hypothetical protein [Caenibius sp. WL]QZP08169.1 hypothetical protein K5X80_16300 [Caenibius sp. WL]